MTDVMFCLLGPISLVCDNEDYVVEKILKETKLVNVIITDLVFRLLDDQYMNLKAKEMLYPEISSILLHLSLVGDDWCF